MTLVELDDADGLVGRVDYDDVRREAVFVILGQTGEEWSLGLSALARMLVRDALDQADRLAADAAATRDDDAP